MVQRQECVAEPSGSGVDDDGAALAIAAGRGRRPRVDPGRPWRPARCLPRKGSRFRGLLDGGGRRDTAGGEVATDGGDVVQVGHALDRRADGRCLQRRKASISVGAARRGRIVSDSAAASAAIAAGSGVRLRGRRGPRRGCCPGWSSAISSARCMTCRRRGRAVGALRPAAGKRQRPASSRPFRAGEAPERRRRSPAGRGRDGGRRRPRGRGRRGPAPSRSSRASSARQLAPQESSSGRPRTGRPRRSGRSS